MSELVVTAGATYTGMDLNTINKQLTDFDKSDDPVLNPDIVELLKPSTEKGYGINDRQEILRSAKTQMGEQPLGNRRDSSLVVLSNNSDDTNNSDNTDDDQSVDGGAEFAGGELLFEMDGSYEGGADDGFDGGNASEYFEW